MQLTSLALTIWQHGLRERGAGPFLIANRVEIATGNPTDPASVSLACRELVAAGYAARSPFGYRATTARQLEIQAQ